MQSLISSVEDADSSYALARFVSVLDVVNSNGLAVKKTKAETVEKCFAKAGFGESDLADNLEESGEKIAAISNLYRGKELSCDTKNFVLSDDHLATHYSFESATALLAVRNTQNEDLEDDEEEQEGGEQDISTKICTHEQAFNCISEVRVMQFATDTNSSSLPELLYTVKDSIRKDTNTNKFLCCICGRNLSELYLYIGKVYCAM
jgi:hypothetical protein